MKSFSIEDLTSANLEKSYQSQPLTSFKFPTKHVASSGNLPIQASTLGARLNSKFKRHSLDYNDSASQFRHPGGNLNTISKKEITMIENEQRKKGYLNQGNSLHVNRKSK